MQISARNGALDIMTLLRENGASVSTRGKKGDDLYHLAAYNGHTHVMQWLSSIGLLHTNVDLYGQTCAHVAARRGEVSILKYLHESLHMTLMQEDFEGKTPLDHIPRQILQGNEVELELTRSYLMSFLPALDSDGVNTDV
jgi:ankyrin repeat protein